MNDMEGQIAINDLFLNDGVASKRCVHRSLPGFGFILLDKCEWKHMPLGGGGGGICYRLK